MCVFPGHTTSAALIQVIPDTAGGDELKFIRNIDNAAFEYAEYIQNASDLGVNTMEYADNSLSIQLSSAAKLISGGMYSPFYVVYQGGYDTHADQINRHGQLMSELSFALHNFYSDLENQGFVVPSLEHLEAQINERDRLDSTREISPLIKAKDAKELITDHMNIEEVIQSLIDLFRLKVPEEVWPTPLQ